MIKRYFWYWLTGFVLVDFLTPYVLTFFYPGYHPLQQVISDLGEAGSPVEGAFGWASVVAGIFLLLSLPGLTTYLKRFASTRISVLISCSLAIFAIGQCLLSGIFSVDRDAETLQFSMVIHQVGSALGNVGMLGFPLLVGLVAYKFNRKRAYWFFFLFVFSLACASLNGYAQAQGLIYKGVYQRLSMIAMYLPIVLVLVDTYTRRKTAIKF